MISMIVAMTNDGLIGNNGKLPWNIPEDMEHFKKTTEGHLLVFGRKTFVNLPTSFKQERQEDIRVLSRGIRSLNFLTISDSDRLLTSWKWHDSKKKIFICGGREIYKEFMHCADNVYLSLIRDKYKGDCYFPCSYEELIKEFAYISKYEHRAEYDFLLLNRFCV